VAKPLSLRGGGGGQVVVKNLRVCGDCHTATKFISKIVARDVTGGDGHVSQGGRVG